MTEHLFHPAPYTHIYDPTNPCIDCGTPTTPKEGRPEDGSWEWYSVHGAVWQAAGMDPLGGCLCIGCLEHRLGRRLVARDFTAYEVNAPSALDSPRLRARMERSAS